MVKTSEFGSGSQHIPSVEQHRQQTKSSTSLLEEPATADVTLKALQTLKMFHPPFSPLFISGSLLPSVYIHLAVVETHSMEKHQI